MRMPLLAFLFVLIMLEGPAAAGPWGPWSTSPDAPVLLMKADREADLRVQDDRPIQPVAATPFLWLLRFYQGTITHVDGDRCPMYPTCSQYSVQAIHRHGPLMGIVMTVDRLMHEADEQKDALMIRVGDRYRFDDPVQNNDFWWFEK